jgi:3'-5' exoribonuclease
VNAVFATPEIYNSFVRVAASHSHHHAFPGGLISHSLDATRLLLNLDLLDGEERELGIVGTLLHDIGKIRTLNPDGTRSRLGHVVDHGELTLEILAPWLTTLEHHWCDGAIALRHIWLPKRHHSGNYPESQIRELVRLVDQISALTNRCETEFEGLPKWRNHVRGADRSHWWRPRKPHSLVNF